jgi:hypothetical protein
LTLPQPNGIAVAFHSQGQGIIQHIAGQVGHIIEEVGNVKTAIQVGSYILVGLFLEAGGYFVLFGSVEENQVLA